MGCFRPRGTVWQPLARFRGGIEEPRTTQGIGFDEIASIQGSCWGAAVRGGVQRNQSRCQTIASSPGNAKRPPERMGITNHSDGRIDLLL
jgi:hypothetical protein